MKIKRKGGQAVCVSTQQCNGVWGILPQENLIFRLSSMDCTRWGLDKIYSTNGMPPHTCNPGIYELTSTGFLM